MAATATTTQAKDAAAKGAEAKREAQKALAAAIKAARTEYGTAVADAKVRRDEVIAAAYADFAAVTGAAAE